MGLETEYGVKLSVQARRSGYQIDIQQFITDLEEEIPVASAVRNPHRFFLANGGCVSFEYGASAEARDPLIESATPECNSPRALLTYQIANEQLIAETLEKTCHDVDAGLIKSCSDAHGHCFGQHESYEVEIGRGWRLHAWRAGLIGLLPVLILYRLTSAIWFLLIWMLAAIHGYCSLWYAGVAMHVAQWWNRTKSPSSPSEQLDAPEFEPTENDGPSPWLGGRRSVRWVIVCAFGLRLLHTPLAGLLWLNIWCFALRPQRRMLNAFFASRCIIDGAGHLDRDNRFWISQRGSVVNAIIGYGSYRSSRPIFRCDSWLRELCSGAPWSPRGYFQLFRSRQRVEIAIGDSGLCEQSQYVRIGATTLVLDLVERRTNIFLPELVDPVGAIGRFSRDWMMLSSVSDKTRTQWTALDIQHAYAAAVRSMLQSASQVPIEAWKILDQWQTTINQLRPSDDETHAPRSMLGRIDWLSKLWLLQQLPPSASWQLRKKVDIRYHELGENGYHRRLTENLKLAPILDEAEIAKARRVPPAGSPASQRGYLIREFSDPDAELNVDWSHATYRVEGVKKRSQFVGSAT